jgi:hypothetical protein
MLRILLTILCALLFLLSVMTVTGDTPAHRWVTAPNAVMDEEEDLLYEVSWTVFKLGTIRLKSLPHRAMEATVNSYDGLPFVDLHAIYYTRMDSSFCSLASYSMEKKNDEWSGMEYVYDPAYERLIVEETLRKDRKSPPIQATVKDTINIPGLLFLDGLSIAYFPRALIHTTQTVTMPTLLYGKLGETTFHFHNRPTTESIDALDTPVRVIELTGTTTVEGIFGMTGEFVGWFSDDAASVPIKGKLKVLIGSVTIELMQWNRRGWVPPQ